MAGDRRHGVRLFAALIVAALASFGLAPSTAADDDSRIKDFYGSYVGTARLAGEADRDIIVSIEPTRKGFSIYTSTVIRDGAERASPGVKWRAETQVFTVSADMPHVFEPVLRESSFTRRRDPDLLAGDTLAWASVRGQTLGVYAMDVLEDGHYELRVFERTLTPLGLDLRFTRYNDGELVRELTGILARTKDGG
jgi:hypothetical protein